MSKISNKKKQTTIDEKQIITYIGYDCHNPAILQLKEINMLNMDRKPYDAPALQELGAMNEITENGSQNFSDTFQGQDGTAFDIAS